jgi:hypothetical protein
MTAARLEAELIQLRAILAIAISGDLT